MNRTLVAVQAQWKLERYRDADAFARWIAELTERAVAGTTEGETLLAFPELIGLPLLFTAGALDAATFERIARCRTVPRLVLGHARRNWRAWLARPAFGLGPLLRSTALEAYDAYTNAFRLAAREANATIVAGSIFLPHIEEEASRGRHVAAPDVHNTAFSFAPTGSILHRARKCYLTDGLESRIGLARGRVAELNAFESSVGRVGVAICLDGFYASVLERFDGLACEIVVQPSANAAAWDRAWPPDPRLREGEAWLRLGLRVGIQDRLHLRYGVNPMLVGDVLDLAMRGRSTIVANARYHPSDVEGLPGIAAIAASDRTEDFVRLVVPAPASSAA